MNRNVLIKTFLFFLPAMRYYIYTINRFLILERSWRKTYTYYQPINQAD